MTALQRTVMVAVTVAVAALAGTAHAAGGNDPCWLWRSVMPGTGAHFYFNLTAFVGEQAGQATNDDDVLFNANICNYTKKTHCGTHASVCLNIDGDYAHAGDFHSREARPLDGLRGMQLTMVGEDRCRRGGRFSTQFIFKCDSASSKTKYTCEYNDRACMLMCKVNSKHACYILGDP